MQKPDGSWGLDPDIHMIVQEDHAMLNTGVFFVRGRSQSARPGRRSTSFPRIRSNALGDPMHHQNSVCRVPLVSGVTFSSFLQLEYSRNISTGG